MLHALTVSPPATDAETAALAAIIGQVFTIPGGSAGTQEWFAKAGGAQHLRVIRDGADVAGGLLVLPLGQWFGGRSVRMGGIAGVATSPDHRGHGVARALMAGTLRDLRADGYPIASLYPATQSLYRRVGYERAGVKLRIGIPTKAIDIRDRDERVTVRRITDADQPAIEACYGERARGTAGLLDRSAYIWGRVRNPRDGAANGYLVEEDGRVTGYTYYLHRQTPDLVPNLWCTDLVALTPRAARRLLAFFADHRSLAGEVAWNGSLADPLLAHLTEQRDVSIVLQNHWMLRVLDVPVALAARGWPVGLSAELHLDVTDDLFAENAGRWTVRIDGGRAEAARGGTGALACDVRGLAAMYAGFLSPAEAAATGALAGSAADIAAAAAAFAGPAPWLADHF